MLLGKREQRRQIRAHIADMIRNLDAPDFPEADNWFEWDDETQKIADRISPIKNT